MWVRSLNNLRHLRSSYPSLIAIITLLGLLMIGCGEKKNVQCEQIFRIVRSITESNKDIDYTNAKQIASKQSWLKGASRLTLAADSVDALKIDHSQLIQYQNQLATVYRIYSQATYDAIQARDNKNFEALKDARTNALKAGKIQRKLIREINYYCVDH